jgi:hypothetical protein
MSKTREIIIRGTLFQAFADIAVCTRSLLLGP